MKKLLAIIFAFSVLQAKTVYFVPFGGCDESRLFFEPYSFRDEIAKVFCCLREKVENMGYKIKFTHDCKDLDDVFYIISFEANNEVLKNITRYPKERCIFCNFEPPVVATKVFATDLSQFFGRNYVMLDDLVDNQNTFKFHYPQPRFEMVKTSIDFSEKKLCTMISGNKDSSHPQSLYHERRNAIFFFENLFKNEQIDDFDLYGVGWDGWLLWKGTVPSKWETYQNYKFSICYDNMGDQNGYITEKIFDSFIGGCVPVYLGAVNIEKYVPKECFIDRTQFATYEELYLFLKNMDEETYNTYLETIHDFLQSPKAELFSIDFFLQKILESISESNS